ncbi:MAG: fumarylacetoacetate hydrolase family protein [Bacteroidota bacterium]|nr:fumarylacetoacetate hydrolase family protein [Bacteroidota bacterium]
MKIFCIEVHENYNPVLDGQIDYSICFYLKPETVLIKNSQPYYYPDFSKQITADVSLVLRINRLGKNIGERFAKLYYNEASVAVAFTLSDVLNNLKQNDLSQDIARTYDNSSAIGNFVESNHLIGTTVSLKINDTVVRDLKIDDVTCNKIISYISEFYTLKIGDLVFISRPSKDNFIKIDDNIAVSYDDKTILTCRIK